MVVVMNKNKSYTVKEWFANKVANEVKRNITMCDVFAVIKETEKAIYAMLNLGCDMKKTMWVPKSVLIEREVGENPSGSYNHETLFIEDYEEASEAFRMHWSQFK